MNKGRLIYIIVTSRLTLTLRYVSSYFQMRMNVTEALSRVTDLI
jgi:hypothetical protein